MEKKFSALLLFFFTLTFRAIYYSLSITKDMKEEAMNMLLEVDFNSIRPFIFQLRKPRSSLVAACSDIQDGEFRCRRASWHKILGVNMHTVNKAWCQIKRRRPFEAGPEERRSRKQWDANERQSSWRNWKRAFRFGMQAICKWV